jgi:EmrB/QacA subfamily drug resistance transporter
MSKRGAGLPTFLITGVAAFMASLDNLVVTTALPTIQREFHSSLSSLEWTVNAYTLTYAVFLLTAALLGDRFGRRATFVTGLTVFTLASALAATAGSVGTLVAARALQGAGGSVIFPLALTLLVNVVPERRRGMSIAGLSGMSGLAIALGPVVGGLIVQFGDWHWIFWVNVPIGVLLAPLAMLWLRESRGPNAKLDVPGTLLVTGGLLGVVYGLIGSGERSWRDPLVAGSALAGVALLVAFALWEYRARFPVVPPRLFRSRGFSFANLVALLQQGGMFGAVFLLMQYLQNVLHYSPLTAGSRTLPWTIMPLVVAPLTGMLAERVGVHRLMVVSGAVQTTALIWLAVVSGSTMDYLAALPALLLAGVGMGVFFALSARQTLDFTPPAFDGVAAGVNSSLRQVGVVLGIAVLAGVFANAGGYGSVPLFVSGLHAALWVGAGVLLTATVLSALTPRVATRGVALVGDPVAA